MLRGLEAEVTKVISNLEVPRGLRINIQKIRHSSKRGARRMTGIVLGSDGHPYIGRRFKRKTRALIYEFDSLDASTRASLSGMIAYASGFDPGFVNSLITKYGLKVVQKAMTGR